MNKVTSKYYDNGKVEKKLTVDTDIEGEFLNYDAYIDEFNSEKEANDFIAGKIDL